MLIILIIVSCYDLIGGYIYIYINCILSGSGREAELMNAVRILIDKMNAGKMEITQDMLSKAGSTTYIPGNIQVCIVPGYVI